MPIEQPKSAQTLRAHSTSKLGLEDSSSHHRMVRYALGDLKCVVWFEADAYCGKKEDPWVLNKRCVNVFSTRREEDMRAKLNQMSPIKLEGAANTSQHTSVVFSGRIVPSSTIAELKTFQSEKFRIEKHLPQLRFGRTQNLLVGTHVDGTFHELENINVASRLLDWETTYQVELCKLAWLVAELRQATRRIPGGCCVLVGRDRARKAIVYTASSRTPILPEYIVK